MTLETCWTVGYWFERGWDIDFYMACFYNLARQTKRVVAVAARGQAEPEEEFDAADRDYLLPLLQ